MSSKLSVANQALSLLGANTISDFDEDSNEAQIICLHYDTVLYDEFSKYPWAFATKKEALERLNDGSGNPIAPINEYAYQFIRPDNAVHIHKLFNDSSSAAYPIQNYDILEDIILAEDAELWAQYSYHSDEMNWPGYFTSFFTHALAGVIAMPLTDDAELANFYKNEAYGGAQNNKGGLRAVALGADKRQQPGPIIANNPLIRSRFQSVYGHSRR